MARVEGWKTRVAYIAAIAMRCGGYNKQRSERYVSLMTNLVASVSCVHVVLARERTTQAEKRTPGVPTCLPQCPNTDRHR